MSLVCALLACGVAAASAESSVPPTLEVEDNVRVLCNGATLLQSPPEGLWSVATDWRDGWPCEWSHGKITEREQAGDWTILRGEVKTAVGTWRVSDSYRPEGRVIKCTRRFVWEGKKAADRCTLSVRFQTPGAGAGVVMPGILYHGNPSGAKSGRTPVYTAKPGEEAVYEEHRFPMPFASLEWKSEEGYRGAALHSLPSPPPYANLDDQWWSMGTIAKEDGTEFVLLSGACASNGKRSVVKAVQPGFFPYDNAYLNVPPGAIIEKTFYLEAYPVAREGSGFQRPVQTSLDLFVPYSLDGLPSFREIIEAKYRFSLTRWHEEEGQAGFRKYPNRSVYVLGWCGQAMAPGYAYQVLAEKLNAPEALDMAQKSLDFLSNAPFFEGGFHTWYDYETKEWDKYEPLSQGQAMLNIANAIRAADKTGLDSTKWRAFLEEACTFHANRILREDWNPKSTDEAFFIAPLCMGHRLIGADAYRAAAEKAGKTYAARCVNMREPYWGGTLDASCEDKEGAFAALQGFLRLYEMTNDPQYLEWAQHACDVALTYVVVWDIDMPPGRLRDHDFKTRGWTAVSVQNQHIDVYGVLIAPDVYRLGKLTGNEGLKRLAIVMYRTGGQLLDPYGSQGEQPQHTNYAQRGKVDAVSGLRGGYVEDWTVFWITAHFLNAGAQFDEMGALEWE
jgi:hypothetical protein